MTVKIVTLCENYTTIVHSETKIKENVQIKKQSVGQLINFC